MTIRLLLSTFFLLYITSFLSGQRVMLVEKLNSAQTQKIFAGDYIQYRLVDDEQWYKGNIEELRPDQQLISFNDRFIAIADIRQLRRGRSGPRTLGVLLTTFGLAWSGFAVIGFATDGDPDTRYRTGDAIVSGISVGTGLLLPALFGTKRTRIGPNQRHRLRIIDISF